MPPKKVTPRTSKQQNAAAAVTTANKATVGKIKLEKRAISPPPAVARQQPVPAVSPKVAVKAPRVAKKAASVGVAAAVMPLAKKARAAPKPKAKKEPKAKAAPKKAAAAAVKQEHGDQDDQQLQEGEIPTGVVKSEVQAKKALQRRGYDVGGMASAAYFKNSPFDTDQFRKCFRTVMVSSKFIYEVLNRLRNEHSRATIFSIGIPNKFAANGRFYFDYTSYKIEELVQEIANRLMSHRCDLFNTATRQLLQQYINQKVLENEIVRVDWKTRPVLQMNAPARVVFLNYLTSQTFTVFCEIVGRLHYNALDAVFSAPARKKAGFSDDEEEFFIILVPRESAIFTETCHVISVIYESYIFQVWPACYIFDHPHAFDAAAAVAEAINVQHDFVNDSNNRNGTNDDDDDDDGDFGQLMLQQEQFDQIGHNNNNDGAEDQDVFAVAAAGGGVGIFGASRVENQDDDDQFDMEF